MNIGRLIISFIVVFCIVSGFEWYFHGTYLKELYTFTAQYWRTEANMKDNYHWLVAGQALFSFMFCFIYARFSRSQSAGDGGFYGVTVALLMSGSHLVVYAVQPLPLILIMKWIIGSIVEGAIAGILLGTFYKSKHNTSEHPTKI